MNQRLQDDTMYREAVRHFDAQAPAPAQGPARGRDGLGYPRAGMTKPFEKLPPSKLPKKPCRSKYTKIFVTKFPYPVERTRALKALAKFGKIRKYYFKCSPNDPDHLLYAIIDYYAPAHATKALHADVIIDSQKVLVRLADPWHQNSAHRKIPDEPPKSTDSDDESPPAESNILSILNEDCFMKIFGYLRLGELMAIERVSKQWRDLVYLKYKSFTSYKDFLHRFTLTSVAAYCLFSRIGTNLKSIHLLRRGRLDYRIPYLIAKFCPNLEELHITNCPTMRLSIVGQKCAQLKCLKLIGTSILSKDKFFPRCIAKLEEITIVKCENKLGNFLYGYGSKASVKKLTIISCNVNCHLFKLSLADMVNLNQLHFYRTTLHDDFVQEAITVLPDLSHLTLLDARINHSMEKIYSLKNLVYLQLSANAQLNDNMVADLVNHCVNLTHLDISMYYNESVNKFLTNEAISVVLSHKNLEHLNVSNLINITDEPFKKMTLRKESKLKVVICRKNNITEEAIIALFKNCPKIEFIDATECKIKMEKISLNPIYDRYKSVLHLYTRDFPLQGEFNPNQTSFNLRLIFNNINNHMLMEDDIFDINFESDADSEPEFFDDSDSVSS